MLGSTYTWARSRFRAGSGFGLLRLRGFEVSWFSGLVFGSGVPVHEFGPVGIQVFSLGTGRRHESLRVGHLMQTEAAPLNPKYPTAALSMPKSLRGQSRLNGNPR